MEICRLGIRIYVGLFCDICRLNDHELVWKYVDWALEYILACSVIFAD